MTFDPLKEVPGLELVKDLFTHDTTLMMGTWKDAAGVIHVGVLTHQDDEVESLTYVLAPLADGEEVPGEGEGAEFRTYFTRGDVQVITVLRPYGNAALVHVEELPGTNLPDAMLPARGVTL
jgi:hypothetical protein